MSDTADAQSLPSFARRCEARAARVVPNGHRGSLGETWYHTSPQDGVYSHSLTPGKVSCEDNAYAVTTAGSEHQNLVNVALGDGSIQAISDTIDAEVWRRMGHRDGVNLF